MKKLHQVKKTEISNAYKGAIALADKSFKDSKALAEKTLKEALAEFEKENSEIGKIKAAIKALTGENTKAPKAKTEKSTSEKAPRTGGYKEKFDAIFESMPLTSSNGDVIKKYAELHPETDLKADRIKINSALITYKNNKKK